MGSFFSLDFSESSARGKRLQDPAASGSQVDANVTLNGSPAVGTAAPSHHPGAAGFTQTGVPTGQKGVGTLTRVADAARDASTESVASAKLP